MKIDPSVRITFLNFNFNKFNTHEKLKRDGIVKIPKTAIIIAPFNAFAEIADIAKNV